MAVVLDHEDYLMNMNLLQKLLNNIQMFFKIIFYDFKSKKLIASVPYDVSMPFFAKRT